MKTFFFSESQGKFVNGKYCASNQTGQCSGELVVTVYTSRSGILKIPIQLVLCSRLTFGHFSQYINRNTGYIQTAHERFPQNPYRLLIHEVQLRRYNNSIESGRPLVRISVRHNILPSPYPLRTALGAIRPAQR